MLMPKPVRTLHASDFSRGVLNPPAGARDGTSRPGTQSWNLKSGGVVHLWQAPQPTAILILQHGFGEYTERYFTSYLALIPSLLDAGFDVYGIDMSGHGRAGGQRAVVDIRGAVADHLAVRRSLRQQGLPVFLLGHSLGGLVTAASVAHDPAGVSGVVITSPSLPGGLKPALRFTLRLLSGIAPNRPIPVPSGDTGGLSRIPAVTAAVLEDPLMYKGAISNRTAESAVQTAKGLFKRAPLWAAPVLLLHGSADTVTDPARTEALFRLIGSADKSLSIVPGGFHELLNDIGGEQILRHILTWLDTHRAIEQRMKS